jgi:hypothetical protein
MRDSEIAPSILEIFGTKSNPQVHDVFQIFTQSLDTCSDYFHLTLVEFRWHDALVAAHARHPRRHTPATFLPRPLLDCDRVTPHRGRLLIPIDESIKKAMETDGVRMLNHDRVTGAI